MISKNFTLLHQVSFSSLCFSNRGCWRSKHKYRSTQTDLFEMSRLWSSTELIWKYKKRTELHKLKFRQSRQQRSQLLETSLLSIPARLCFENNSLLNARTPMSWCTSHCLSPWGRKKRSRLVRLARKSHHPKHPEPSRGNQLFFDLESLTLHLDSRVAGARDKLSVQLLSWNELSHWPHPQMSCFRRTRMTGKENGFACETALSHSLHCATLNSYVRGFCFGWWVQETGQEVWTDALFSTTMKHNSIRPFSAF